MTTTFADRWGVPVQAGNGAAVLLLDQAVPWHIQNGRGVPAVARPGSLAASASHVQRRPSMTDRSAGGRAHLDRHNIYYDGRDSRYI
jgi:hypothetical protein